MPRKRSNGEGSMHKRPNGLWEWQIMVGRHPDGRRKMKSFYAKTQKEVKEKARKYLEELQNAPELRNDMPFEQWADIWYEGMKGQVSDTTYEGYRYTLAILKDYFGKRELSSIKALDVERFLKQMIEDGRSKSTLPNSEECCSRL